MIHLRMDEKVMELSDNNADPDLNNAVKQAYGRYLNDENDMATLLINETNKKHLKLATYFAIQLNQDEITINTENQEIKKWLQHIEKEALEKTISILKRRIDSTYGISVQIGIRGNAIILELPEKYDILHSQLLNRGDAGFYETFSLTEIYPYLWAADRSFTRKLQRENIEAGKYGSSLKNIELIKQIKKREGDNYLKKFYLDFDTMGMNSGGILLGMLFNNITEPTNIIISMPIGGIVDTANMSKADSILHLPELRAKLPVECIFKWSFRPESDSGGNYTGHIQLFSLMGMGPTLREPTFGSWNLNGAHAVHNKRGANYHIGIDISDRKNILATVTQRNTSKTPGVSGKFIVIVIDGKVYSIFECRETNRTGYFDMPGEFTEAKAKELAAIISSGSLPCTIVAHNSN